MRKILQIDSLDHSLVSTIPKVVNGLCHRRCILCKLISSPLTHTKTKEKHKKGDVTNALMLGLTWLPGQWTCNLAVYLASCTSIYFNPEYGTQMQCHENREISIYLSIYLSIYRERFFPFQAQALLCWCSAASSILFTFVQMIIFQKKNKLVSSLG